MHLVIVFDIPCDTMTVVAIALIVSFMTALSAIDGFGFGTVAVPMLLLVLPPSVKVGAGTGWTVLLSIWRRVPRLAIWSTSLIGFLTGVMGRAAGLLAPAVVVCFTGRQFPTDVFRATTLALFLIIEVVGLPALVLRGAIAPEDIRFALLLVPAAIAGRLSGLRPVRCVPAARSRAPVIVLLFLMATGSLSGAQGLLR